MGRAVAHQNNGTTGAWEAGVDAFAEPLEVATRVLEISGQTAVWVTMRPPRRRGLSRGPDHKYR